ncbi:Crp/Fnr family transcriptional regulator [Adhaeribacter sp. BT258]|uniref:Crp/Fnr family transcriptional regulator n=1 Tax=Adhaeribacter terrigena TaxID=2793070 RepID=A0ABS1BXM2_9BACT|nr:Crp/Fnr family transcriptional regulator [Adhaeribacter terrigena]MBK0401783.1 Crp/Fnr family transcriptional regulator [Adhaeribacter terrigena]
MQQLITFLSKLANFTASELEQISSFWSRRQTFNRGEFIVRAGEVETQVHFVLEGTQTIHYLENGKDICVGFGYPGTILIAYPSFITGKPSDFYLQAIKKTELLSLNYSDWKMLLETLPKFKDVWHKLTEQALLGMMAREVELHLASNAERYERLLKRSPQLLQQIPQRYVASYLKMEPETLSRLKKATAWKS